MSAEFASSEYPAQDHLVQLIQEGLECAYVGRLSSPDVKKQGFY